MSNSKITTTRPQIYSQLPHSILSRFTDDVIKELPSYYRYDVDKLIHPDSLAINENTILMSFVMNRIVNNLATAWFDSPDIVVDTKMHMLMPDHYPCIPGWHFDNITRDKNGKVEIDKPQTHDHLLVVIDSYDYPTGSVTEFLDEEVTMEFDVGEDAENIYSQLNYKLTPSDNFLDQDDLNCNYTNVESGALVQFGPLAAHQGVVADGRGFRYFIRFTKNRGYKALNEVRNQNQVYLSEEALRNGW